MDVISLVAGVVGFFLATPAGDKFVDKSFNAVEREIGRRVLRKHPKLKPIVDTDLSLMDQR